MAKIIEGQTLRIQGADSDVLNMFKIPLKQQERRVLHVDADAFFASVEQV